MTSDLPADIKTLLTRVGNDKGLRDFDIKLHGLNAKGEGYMGTLFYVTLEEKKTLKKLEVVVKKAHSEEGIRKMFSVQEIYSNECFFYSTIWPILEDFQEQYLGVKIFDKIAKCYATNFDRGMEKLILENLKHQQFELFDKRLLFDKEHLEFIFKQYGKFHAVAFVYKKLYPQKFHEMSNNIIGIFEKSISNTLIKEGIVIAYQESLDFIQYENGGLIKDRMKEYVATGAKKFYDILKYEGKYSTILHGDCWSNNMMFKYDKNGKLVDLRFLDFQSLHLGTPVYDLSYCFYSGGSKDKFDRLDHYLKIYHEELSQTIRKFSCEPDEIYPFSVLKEEWKAYSKFGFTLALLLLKSKLFYKDSIPDIKEAVDNVGGSKKMIRADMYDKVIVRQRTVDLVKHMYDKDFL